MPKRTKAADLTARELAAKLYRQYGDKADRIASNRADTATTEATRAAYERAWWELDRMRLNRALNREG